MFDWIKRKTPEPALPSPRAEPDRYKGRPLLIILENYVLSCIGHLTAEEEARVAQAVQRVWKGSNDWKQTVRTQLNLGDTLDQNFRDLWTQNLAIAQKNAVTLHPAQFAKMIADQNFAHLLSE